MSITRAQYRSPGGRLSHNFLGTSSAIVKNQVVYFGTTDDLVTDVTEADGLLPIGVAVHGLSAAEITAGKRVEVELLGSAILMMLAGGTVTRGTCLALSGTTGKVVDAGAAASLDGQSIVGRAMASGVDGDLVPVLIK